MKRHTGIRTFAVLCAAACVLTGCTAKRQPEPLFVYGLALEREGADVYVSVLARKGAEENEKDGEAGESADGSKKRRITRHRGKDVASAMTAFFDSYPNIYAGTCGVYVLPKEGKQTDMADFCRYLLSSPGLPLKVGVILSETPAETLAESNEEYADAREWERMVRELPENVIRYAVGYWEKNAW